MSWAIHNLIGHPLMGLCQLVGWHALGEALHDATLPKDGAA